MTACRHCLNYKASPQSTANCGLAALYQDDKGLTWACLRKGSVLGSDERLLWCLVFQLDPLKLDNLS